MAVTTKDEKQLDVWEKKFNLLKAWKLENTNADEPCRDTSLGKWLHGQRKIFRRSLGGKRNKKVVLNRKTKITLFKKIGIDIQLLKPTKTTRVISQYKCWKPYVDKMLPSKHKQHKDMKKLHETLSHYLSTGSFNVV